MAFQTGIAVVGRATFGLHPDVGFPLRGHVFQRRAVAVFPVVAVVEDTFEPYLVVVVELPVERQRITLTLAGDKILPYLVVIDIYFAVVVFLPNEFGVV